MLSERETLLTYIPTYRVVSTVAADANFPPSPLGEHSSFEKRQPRSALAWHCGYTRSTEMSYNAERDAGEALAVALSSWSLGSPRGERLISAILAGFGAGK